MLYFEVFLQKIGCNAKKDPSEQCFSESDRSHFMLLFVKDDVVSETYASQKDRLAHCWLIAGIESNTSFAP